MTVRCVCAVCLHPLSGDDDCLARFEARELWQCPKCKATVIHGPCSEAHWFRPVEAKSPDLMITNNTQHELDFSVHTVCGCPSASTKVWVSASKDVPPVHVIDKRHAVSVQPSRLPSFGGYYWPPVPPRENERSLLLVFTGEQFRMFDDWCVYDLEKSMGPEARWLLVEFRDGGRLTLAQAHDRNLLHWSDLLSAGIEGGVQYWAEVLSGDAPTQLPPNASEEVFSCDWPLLGGSLRVVEVPEGPLAVHTLDGAAVSRGSAVFSRECPASYSRAVAGEFDAADGDRFVQCCLFGKVVYA